MHPHRDMPRPPVDHELDVHPVRVGRGRRDRRRDQQIPGVREVVHERHRVRIAHVDVARGPAAPADAHGDLALGEPRPPHADRHVPVLGEVDPLHAAPRGDGEVARPDVPGALEIAREDPYAVAAHLRDRAVRVAVVHEPLGLGSHPPGLGVRRGPHDVQQAVPADARAAVAQRGDGGRGQVEGVLGVRDDHEVVLGAVSLEEGDPRAHTPIVRAGYDTRPPVPQRSRATRHTASTTTAVTTTA